MLLISLLGLIPADFYVFDQADASIPSAAYPTGGVEVYSKFPKLYWTLSGPSQGLSFNVRYGLSSIADLGSPGGGETVYTINNIAQLYVTLFDGIEGGSEYKWQVQSTDGVTPSDWSDVATFKIYDFSADLIPILSWPIGGNTVFSTDVNFAWHVEGPSLGLTYDLEYNTANSFVGGQISLTNLTSNLHTVSGLTPGQTYWWRVKVSSETTWSSVESFVVIPSEGAVVPILNWPVGGATVWATSQEMSWTIVGSTAGLTYVLYYDDNSGMSSPDSVTALTSTSTTLSSLTAGTTYYWKVRADNGAAVGDWSNTEVFVVFSGINPAVPLVGSPSNVEVNTSSPTLSWFSPTYLDHAVTYEVEYSQDAGMNNSTKVEDLSAPSYTTSNLNNGTYYWRSRTKNDDGSYSEYTETAKFDVNGVTDVDVVNELPTDYSLSQNYPNPFNPTTNIKFSLPEAGYITLKVYNMIGQEVRTLINKESQAGTFNVNWNGKDNFGKNVTSGAYIYQIISGDFIQTKKMILLK